MCMLNRDSNKLHSSSIYYSIQLGKLEDINYLKCRRNRYSFNIKDPRCKPDRGLDN